MSLFSSLTEEIRRTESYLPPCPWCSHIGVVDFPDMIAGPCALRSIRTVHHDDGTRDRVPRHSLTRCCALSDGCPWFKTPQEAASWWRARRLEPHPEPAMDNRRISTLQRLEIAGLEPL